MESHTEAYICLGSNSDTSWTMLERAARSLAGIEGASLARLSDIYETEPQEFENQPWFVNQVAAMHIGERNIGERWHAQDFLARLLSMEKALGRARSEDPALRYGPRCIDIDLLLFGDREMATPFCFLPHPRMLKRAFVLVPLLQIAPDLRIRGKKIAEWLNALDYRLEGHRIFQSGQGGKTRARG